MENLIHALPFFILLFVWLMAFIGIRHKRVRSEARRDVQVALLNKFQTGEEITKFLATDEGRRLISELGAPHDARHAAVGLTIGACVTGSLSLGLWAASFLEHKSLQVPAIITGSVCIGLVLAAIISRRLTRSLDRDRQDG